MEPAHEDTPITVRDLVIRRVKSDYSVHLLLQGELDSYSVRALDKCMRNYEHGGCRKMVVDLTDLSFVDSNGLRILIEGARRAGAGGWSFRVVNPRGTVRKIFDITQMDSVLSYWGGSEGAGAERSTSVRQQSWP